MSAARRAPRPWRPPAGRGALVVNAVWIIATVVLLLWMLASTGALSDLARVLGLPDGRSTREVLDDLPDTETVRALEALPDRDGEEIPAYDRDAFGEAWADVDGNGCDTRNDVLARDLTGVKVRATDPCVVVSGTLDDPYTGGTIDFVRGEKTSAAVQIDHVVALADAWRSGAWRWSASEREEFANDPLNLLAVDGPTNEDKAAGRADQWLPPDTSIHCAYVARQIRVKTLWHLSVTPSERSAMAEVLATCNGG